MTSIPASLRLSLAVVLVFAQLTVVFLFHGPVHSPGIAAHTARGPNSVDATQAVRISKIYVAGDLGGAVYPQDFVELFNNSGQTVSLLGWSFQYGTPGSTSVQKWTVKPLGDTRIAPHSFFLVGLRQGDVQASVTPDVSGFINLDRYGGKAAVVNSTIPIALITDLTVVDAVGYGTANAWEGPTPVPSLSLTTTAVRMGVGCIDTDNNGADFEVVDFVLPRNSQSLAHFCDTAQPAVESTTPAPGATGVAPDANVTVTFSEAVIVDTNWFEVQCGLSGTRDANTAVVTGGPQTFTIDPNEDFHGDETCRLTIYASAVHDEDAIDPPDTLAADYVVDFQTAGPLAAEISSFAARGVGERVELVWETISEQAIVGFELYRSTSPQGTWERANAGMIPASAPGAGAGASYHYEEPAGGAGKWWYRLDAVDLSGRSAVLALAEVDILAPTAVGLTRFRADTMRLPVALAMLIAGTWLVARVIGSTKPAHH